MIDWDFGNAWGNETEETTPDETTPDETASIPADTTSEANTDTSTNASVEDTNAPSDETKTPANETQAETDVPDKKGCTSALRASLLFLLLPLSALAVCRRRRD